MPPKKAAPKLVLKTKPDEPLTEEEIKNIREVQLHKEMIAEQKKQTLAETKARRAALLAAEKEKLKAEIQAQKDRAAIERKLAAEQKRMEKAAAKAAKEESEEEQSDDEDKKLPPLAGVAPVPLTAAVPEKRGRGRPRKHPPPAEAQSLPQEIPVQKQPQSVAAESAGEEELQEGESSGEDESYEIVVKPKKAPAKRQPKKAAAKKPQQEAPTQPQQLEVKVPTQQQLPPPEPKPEIEQKIEAAEKNIQDYQEYQRWAASLAAKQKEPQKTAAPQQQLQQPLQQLQQPLQQLQQPRRQLPFGVRMRQPMQIYHPYNAPMMN